MRSTCAGIAAGWSYRKKHGLRALYHHIDKVPRKMELPVDRSARRHHRAEISDDGMAAYLLSRRSGKLRRGISSVFLLPDQGIEHILRLSPEVKIIFSLRDPIERNWSQIRMISTGKSEERAPI